MDKATNTTIIGAGPIGSYLGYLLSKKGIKNTIVEEHSEIGRPEQCAGLISRNIEGLVPTALLRKAVQNRVYGAVISCQRQEFEVRTANFKAYVFDRAELDRAIAEKAQNKGSELLLSHRYINHQPAKKGLKIRLYFSQKAYNQAKYLHSSLLVGADGPLSKVAKNSYLYGGRKFWVGKQVILKTRMPFFDKKTVYVYLDKKYSNGFFAWVVPINENKAKVGLASATKPAEHLNKFLKDKFDNFVVEEKHAGLIPIYKKIPLQNKQKNIFLVGDAALQVKATSGGGVVNGMIAAKGLAEAIATGRFDYERRIRKIRRNLRVHLMIRNKLNSMADKRKAELLKEMDDDKIKQVLRQKGDMDFVAGFGFRVLVGKPGLMRFIF